MVFKHAKGRDWVEDLKKVRTMINLAIYDKQEGIKDREITSLFRRDYIYRKNLDIRLGVVLALILLIVIYYANQVFVKEVNIFELFGRDELVRIGTFSLIVLIIFSIIGTIVNGASYDAAEERYERYENILSKLHSQGDKDNGTKEA